MKIFSYELHDNVRQVDVYFSAMLLKLLQELFLLPLLPLVLHRCAYRTQLQFHSSLIPTILGAHIFSIGSSSVSTEATHEKYVLKASVSLANTSAKSCNVFSPSARMIFSCGVALDGGVLHESKSK